MKIHLAQTKQITNFMENIEVFVDSEFVKTCDELVIIGGHVRSRNWWSTYPSWFFNHQKIPYSHTWCIHGKTYLVSYFYFIVQVILCDIDCAIFFTNLHELFCQFNSWTNWVNSGNFMDNGWISCQVMADLKKV